MILHRVHAEQRRNKYRLLAIALAAWLVFTLWAVNPSQPVIAGVMRPLSALALAYLAIIGLSTLLLRHRPRWVTASAVATLLADHALLLAGLFLAPDFAVYGFVLAPIISTSAGLSHGYRFMVGSTLLFLISLSIARTHPLFQGNAPLFLFAMVASGVVPLYLYRVGAELARAAEHARALSQTKTRLLARIQRDASTPLGAMLTTTEALASEPLPPRLQRLLGGLVDNAQSLRSTLDLVTDLRSIEDGKLAVSEQPFSLRTLFANARHALEPRAMYRNLEFNVFIDDALPDAFHGDPRRLLQLLLFFADDSLRSTRNGYVSLNARRHGQLGQHDFELAFIIIDTREDWTPLKLRSLAELAEDPDAPLDESSIASAVVVALFEQWRVKFHVDANAGRGRVVNLIIPLRPASGSVKEPLQSESLQAVFARHRREVAPMSCLLYSDDRATRRALGYVLERAGHHLASGHLPAAPHAPTEHQAVLLDLDLPLATVRRTLTTLSLCRPPPPVLLLASDALPGQDLPDSPLVRSVLNKPVSTPALLAALADVAASSIASDTEPFAVSPAATEGDGQVASQPDPLRPPAVAQPRSLPSPAQVDPERLALLWQQSIELHIDDGFSLADIHDILPLRYESLAQGVEAMHEAMANKDPQGFKAHVHALRNDALYFHPELAQLLLEIEQHKPLSLDVPQIQRVAPMVAETLEMMRRFAPSGVLADVLQPKDSVRS